MEVQGSWPSVSRPWYLQFHPQPLLIPQEMSPRPPLDEKVATCLSPRAGSWGRQ